MSDGNAESCEAVQEGYANLQLDDLTVEVARGQSLADRFDTVHPIVGKTVPRTIF